MKILKSIMVKLGDKEYPYRNCIQQTILYEKEFDSVESLGQTTESIIKFIYYGFVAAGQFEGKEFNLDYNQTLIKLNQYDFNSMVSELLPPAVETEQKDKKK